MLSIIVALPKIEDAKKIKSVLLRNDYDVIATCTTIANVLEVAKSYDKGIIISTYRLVDGYYMDLYNNLNKSFELLLIASPKRIENGIEDYISYIATPLNKQILLDTLSDISEKFRKKKNKTKVKSEEDKQILAKAKEILIIKNNLTEPEAHRFIQKMSMDSGSNLVETAKKVILLYSSCKT